MIWDLVLVQKKGKKIKKVTRVISKKQLQTKGQKKEQKSLTTMMDTTLQIICNTKIQASTFLQRIPSRSTSISRLKNRNK